VPPPFCIGASKPHAPKLAAGVRDSLHLSRPAQSDQSRGPTPPSTTPKSSTPTPFEPVTRIARPCYALLAVFIGKTRLIDNLYIEPVGDSGELAYHL